MEKENQTPQIVEKKLDLLCSKCGKKTGEFTLPVRYQESLQWVSDDSEGAAPDALKLAVVPAQEDATGLTVESFGFADSRCDECLVEHGAYVDPADVADIVVPSDIKGTEAE